MSEHGWESDEWPGIFEEVKAADILVLAGPIWLGDNSSAMKQVHERLYGGSHLLSDRGQYLYYSRVGGCLITGNEDNDFTNRNNVHDWNLMHLAWLLKDAGGVSAYGNQRSGWDSGCRFDFDTPTTDDRR